MAKSLEEAIGHAILFAAKDKPGFSVVMHAVGKIETQQKE
jgi:hypothetical protein